MWWGQMVKYPVQTIIGGTLLLALAFSLSDGSSTETQKSAALIECRAALPASINQSDALPEEHCFQRQAKK
jgi:hypothetical protein